MTPDPGEARRLLAAHLDGGLGEEEELRLLALLEADPALADDAAGLVRVHALLRHRFGCLDDARFVDEVVRAVQYRGESGRFADRVEARLDRRPARRLAAAAAALILAATGFVLMRAAPGPGPDYEPRLERVTGKTSLAEGGALPASTPLVLEEGAEAVLRYPDGSRIRFRGPGRLVRPEGEGKQLQLREGRLEAELRTQPAARPFRLSLELAEAASGGGAFSVVEGPAGLEASASEGRVRWTRKADGRRVDLAGGYALRLGRSGDPVLELVRDVEIRIDPSRRRQRVEGFGTSIMGWKPRLAALYRTPEFAEAWAGDLGATLLRVPVEPDCLPDETVDPQGIGEHRLLWRHPSVVQVIELARALRARGGRDFQLIASVWSPPGWMKTTGTTVGTGRLRDDRRVHFARFLAAFCRGVEARSGVPVAALSLRNEAEWGVRFASCTWTPDDFLAASEEIQTAFVRAGLRTRLLGPELVGRSRLEPMGEAASFARALGRRAAGCSLALQGPLGPGEDDEASWDALRGTLEPGGRGLWVTSAADHLPDWIGPGGALSLASELHAVLVHGGAEAYLYYQFADDDPTIALTRGAEARSPKYAAFRHYSRFIRPGAVLVEATPDGAALAAGAFWHDASSTLTAVLVNRESQPIRVTLRPGVEASGMALHLSDAVLRCEPAGFLRMSEGAVVLEMPPWSAATLQTIR
jgi:O-glycosyl hydrolase